MQNDRFTHETFYRCMVEDGLRNAKDLGHHSRMALAFEKLRDFLVVDQSNDYSCRAVVEEYGFRLALPPDNDRGVWRGVIWSPRTDRHTRRLTFAEFLRVYRRAEKKPRGR